MDTLFSTKPKTEFEFSEKKEVFFSKLKGTFDTPKKLNRSAKTVPAKFIEKIEAGEVNSADIKALENSFPIFTYQSCLTIHGNLPTIERTSVGTYKNIIQNKNGSLEIRWSAIDYQSKKEIRSYLAFGCNWSAFENSTHGIYFEQTERTDNKQDALILLAKKRAEAEKINIDGMTAKIFVQGYAYFGRFYIITTILPYSITSKPIFVASQLTGISEAELSHKQAEKEAESAERAKKAEDARQHKEQQQASAEAQLSHLRKTYISAIIGSVYVLPTVTVQGKPAFRFYQIAEKGTFGRVIAKTYLSLEPKIEAERFEPFMKGKQVKLSEITTKQVYSIN